VASAREVRPAPGGHRLPHLCGPGGDRDRRGARGRRRAARLPRRARPCDGWRGRRRRTRRGGRRHRRRRAGGTGRCAA
jgi:hypothetical protein